MDSLLRANSTISTTLRGGGYFYFYFCNTLVFSFTSPFFGSSCMQERKNVRTTEQCTLYGLVLPIGAS